jgi:hypothetical protein
MIAAKEQLERLMVTLTTCSVWSQKDLLIGVTGFVVVVVVVDNSEGDTISDCRDYGGGL